MQCSKCRAECPDDFSECPRCGAPVLHGQPGFDPLLDLVVVLETNDRIQLAMAKGLLEDAAIPFFVLGQIATLVQDIDPFLQKWVRLQVPRDREAQARDLLEAFVHAEDSSAPN
jgi:Putative prokaryotic signal transducing protein